MFAARRCRSQVTGRHGRTCPGGCGKAGIEERTQLALSDAEGFAGFSVGADAFVRPATPSEAKGSARFIARSARNPGRMRPGLHFVRSRYQRGVGDPGGAKDPAVALDFRRGPQRLGIVVGKLHGWPSFDGRDLADQADGIKTAAVVGIAAAKVVGEQRPPAGTEADAAVRSPLGAIVKIGGAAKIGRGETLRQSPAKIGMEAKDRVYVERVGCDNQLLARIAPARFQPRDELITSHVRILAVYALARPVGHPVGRADEKLRCSKRIG